MFEGSGLHHDLQAGRGGCEMDEDGTESYREGTIYTSVGKDEDKI